MSDPYERIPGRVRRGMSGDRSRAARDPTGLGVVAGREWPEVAELNNADVHRRLQAVIDRTSREVIQARLGIGDRQVRELVRHARLSLGSVVRLCVACRFSVDWVLLGRIPEPAVKQALMTCSITELSRALGKRLGGDEPRRLHKGGR
ncbi:MAG: hypothetical protein JNM07_08745 [Phycisphaerae bacterium]|nr:hypothetical protein [Phycisphaerae bacterium]